MNKNTNKHLEDLSTIRSIMERSSSFLSLSGLSGVFAGMFALAGAGFAYWYIYFKKSYEISYSIFPIYAVSQEMLFVLIADALIVLVLAIVFGLYFTYRNSKRKNINYWDKTARRMLINLLIPLATGGIFGIILIYHGAFFLIGSVTLIFYGLALVNASKYTVTDIRYLGVSEIFLGLLASVNLGYSLYFWALGFGVLHIVYGMVMYMKYEKNN